MSASEEAAIQYSDRRLNQKNRPELKQIAGAMGLDNTLKKTPLLRSIQQHMEKTLQLADDLRFMPLFAHRADPKAAGKTSASKAAEDASKGAKPPKAMTG